MKKIMGLLLCLVIVLGLYVYKDTIITNISDFLSSEKIIEIPQSNIYIKDDDFLFVQNTDKFEPTNDMDIRNIFYTTINSGWDSFEFYCVNNDFSNCISEVNKLGNDEVELNQLNNFVHPYNSYQYIETVTNSQGKVTINITKMYNSTKQQELNNKVNEIIKEVITNNMTNKEKIRAIHDYIINNTKYDTVYAETGKSKYQSNNAYGTLIEGRAICGGYADAMAIFLDLLGIKNYKIASTTHIWNFVELDGKWYHLDLTWDDPVIKNSNRNKLDHTYFLITTAELERLDKEQHTFDKAVYIEAK